MLIVAAAVVFSVGIHGTEPDGPHELRLPASARQHGDVIEAAYSRLLDAVDARGEGSVLSQATPGQRMLYALRVTNDEIANGGLSGVLYNVPRGLVDAAIAGARRIRATAYANLLSAATALYPSGRPSDQDPRLDALDNRWREGMFSPQLRGYMDRHPGEFFRQERD